MRRRLLISEDDGFYGHDSGTGHFCFEFLYPDVEYLFTGAEEFFKIGELTVDWV
jgi:hypothetical protein